MPNIREMKLESESGREILFFWIISKFHDIPHPPFSGRGEIILPISLLSTNSPILKIKFSNPI